MQDRICPKCNLPIPSHYPRCVSDKCVTKEVLNIFRPPTGGVYTALRGYKYPLRGNPEWHILGETATVKRMLIVTLKVLIKTRFIFFLALVPRKKLLSNLQYWIEQIYIANYKQIAPPLIEYSQPSKELRRVLIKLFGEHDWIECLVLIFEMDFAYRWRIQDCFSNVNIIALHANPKKELLRLIDLAFEREQSGAEGVKSKLQVLRKFIPLALFFYPNLEDLVIKFFCELDMNEFKMDICDVYFTSNKFDYNFGGKTFEERMAWRVEEDKINMESDESKAVEPKVEVSFNNQFYKLTPEQAKKMMGEATDALYAEYLKGHEQVGNSSTTN